MPEYPRLATETPDLDPTPIFEIFRGAYATELLTIAVAHLPIFEQLAVGPLSELEVAARLGLAPRPMTVLSTALAAMGLLARDGLGNLALTPLASEHLLRGGPFYIGDYIGLAADSAGVIALRDCLKSNRPVGSEAEEEKSASSAAGAFAPTQTTDKGTAFIYRPDSSSAMEDTGAARMLTLALAGRAKNVAPALAREAQLENAQVLLDVGGGTGIYSIACLQQYPNLRAIVWDRPEVLRVAAEFAAQYGVADRLELMPGDMFNDPVPAADAMLVSNILHDWDVPECRALVGKCASSLSSGGRLLIHDVFLNDALDGPLPIALYSAALFTLTEGRAYSAAEYRAWLTEAGLSVSEPRATLVHCGFLVGQKS